MSAGAKLKAGRNETCSCGSGRKFKKCCGRTPDPQPKSQPTDPEKLQSLFALAQQGRFAQLEQAAQSLLMQQPAAGMAWKLLALALSRQGKDAMGALEQAAVLLPNDAESHSNLGNALRRLGKLPEAIASHQRALAIAPGYAEGHNNLGAARLEAGQITEAIGSYRQAIRLKPDFALAIINLGRGLLASGNAHDATLAFRRAIDLNPGYAAAHAGLAAALMAQGQPQDALGACRSAVELEPGSALAHWHLGNVLVELGRPAEAVTHYRAAVGLNSAFAMAHSNLGCALRDLGQTQLALESFERALQLLPEEAEIHNNLGIVLRLLHRPEEAVSSAARARALNPGLAAPLVSLARLHADAGDFGVAEDTLREALAIDRNCAEACSAIVGLRTMTPTDSLWLSDAQRIATRRLPLRHKVHLHYAMGKYFDDVADFEQAFDHYHEANTLKKRYVAPYDRERRQRHIDRVVGLSTGEWAREIDSGAAIGSKPVFIVGMPRAGTSLAEQILASHPLIHGAGELPFWGQAQASWPLGGPSGAGEEELLRSLAAQYQELVDSKAPGAERVVDKMPENYLNLGLIHAALPKARIIHLQRHPLDTCLSIYFQDFEATYSYANDLADLAHCYGEYLRVMAHWRAVLPVGTMLEVPYEALVAAPEEWSRKIVAFLGIEWDQACLDFHRTKRTVITASKWQVRQKMSSRSVQRWRNYEPHLGPLRSLTAASVTTP